MVSSESVSKHLYLPCSSPDLSHARCFQVSLFPTSSNPLLALKFLQLVPTGSHSAPFAPLGPASCSLCRTVFVVGQSPCCMPPPPHFFNLRAFANAVPLPRMLPTSLPPPNLLKANPSSPLSGRCPSLLSWEPTLESFIICSFELFSYGFTCDNYVCPTSLGDL